MTTSPYRATSYQLDEVILTSPRLDEERGVDISNIVVEINLYENIELPYVAGDITIADSANLTSIIKFNGQEKVTIRLAVDEQYPLEREYVVYALRYQGKSINDNSSLLVLSIMEEHAFISHFKRLSWRYGGNARDIVRSVLTSDLGLDPDGTKLRSFDGEEPVQSFNFLVPNWTPMKFIDTVTRRSTTDIGEPFFCYSSLREGVVFRSLAELLTSAPTNPNEPYKYTQVARTTDLVEEKRVILTAVFPESDNSVRLARQGALGMRYFVVDPFDPAKNDDAKFTIVDHFNRKKEAGTTLNAFTPYDEEFTIGDDERLHDLESQFYSQVNTSLSYGETRGFDEEPDVGAHLRRVSRMSDVSVLDKERYEIGIPGYTLLDSDANTSIGRVISVIMTSNLPAVSDTPSEEIMDDKRGSVGALFLVRKCRHSFDVKNQYKATLEISRTDKNKALSDNSSAR